MEHKLECQGGELDGESRCLSLHCQSPTLLQSLSSWQLCVSKGGYGVSWSSCGEKKEKQRGGKV